LPPTSEAVNFDATEQLALQHYAVPVAALQPESCYGTDAIVVCFVDRLCCCLLTVVTICPAVPCCGICCCWWFKESLNPQFLSIIVTNKYRKQKNQCAHAGVTLNTTTTTTTTTKH